MMISDYIAWIHYVYHKRLTGIFWTFFCKIKFKLVGVTFGKNLKCFGNVAVIRYRKSSIIIGDNVNIVSSTIRCSASSIYAKTKIQTLSKSARILIGNGVGLNGTSIVARSKSISIGAETMVGPNSTIVDSDFHAVWPPENRLMNPAFEKDKDVMIGQNVWIGMQCIILKGAKIGENSVIMTGSIVQKKILANVLAQGQPAETVMCLGAKKD